MMIIKRSIIILGILASLVMAEWVPNPMNLNAATQLGRENIQVLLKFGMTYEQITALAAGSKEAFNFATHQAINARMAGDMLHNIKNSIPIEEYISMVNDIKSTPVANATYAYTPAKAAAVAQTTQAMNMFKISNTVGQITTPAKTSGLVAQFGVSALGKICAVIAILTEFGYCEELTDEQRFDFTLRCAMSSSEFTDREKKIIGEMLKL